MIRRLTQSTMPESCPAPFVPGFFSPNPPIMPGGYYATFSVPSYFAPSYFSPNPPIMSGQHYASYVPQWFIPKRPTVLHSPVPPAPTHLRTDWDSRLPIYQIAASQQSYPESRGRSQSDSTSDHKRSRSSSCSNRDARACGFGRTTPTAVTRGNPTTAERPSGTDKPLVSCSCVDDAIGECESNSEFLAYPSTLEHRFGT